MIQLQKKVNFISKEEAAAQYARDIGEDFLEFLGYNPLLNSVDVYFNAAYVNTVSLTQTQRELETSDFVDEVVFDQPLVTLLDENILNISYVLLLTTLLFIGNCALTHQQFHSTVNILQTIYY